MAAEVQPIPLMRSAQDPIAQTADQAFWKTFKNQILLPSPHNAGVTSINAPDFNPAGSQADAFAVTSGNRVQMYSIKTRKLLKTVSRFGVDDIARSGTLRRDGRILLAGGDSGVIQAFDTGSRAILRQWRGQHGHKLPVHTIRWSPAVLTDLMSCSDDRTVRTWDLTEDAAKWTGVGHQDYVRCGAYLPGQSGHMIVSGSYDQTVRIWDTRMNGNSAALTFKFPAPVEDTLPLNNFSLATAAGNEVYITNLASAKTEHVIRAHQKTVTSLTSAHNGGRLLTGALDGHVKAHNTASWEVVAGFKYPAPVLSLSVVPSPAGQESEREDRHLAVGMSTGLLSIRTRLAGAEKAKTREREKKMAAIIAGEGDEYERKQKRKDLRQGIRARDRGKDFQGEGADIVITGNDRPRQKTLQPWQQSLRKGEYSKALDQALPGKKDKTNADSFFTLLLALRHRSALRAALADRSDERLIPILKVTWNYIHYPQHFPILNDVMLHLLDLYSQRVDDWQHDDGEGLEAFSMLLRIRGRVRTASEWADQATRMLGTISMLETG